MKEKYLIALDMDGTLLNSNKEICEETANYLRKLNDEGYPIVIVSGRPYRAILPYYNQLGLTTPVICYNGSYIINPHTKEVSQKEMIPGNIITEIIEAIGEENFKNILCENDTDCYMLRQNDALFGFFWKEGMNIHYGSLKDLDKQYIMIIQMANHDFDDKLVKICFSYPGLGIRFWLDSNLTSELYFLDTNKGSALLRVAAQLNIPSSNIIAFGDAGNDIPMFEAVEKAYVMKSASREMLELPFVSIAKDDNDNDGIKKTLEYILATNK